MKKQFTSSVFIWNPRIKKLLLVNHKKFGKWMIPGGHIEKYENPTEAAVREVREECGISIELKNPLVKDLFSAATENEYVSPLFIVEEVISKSLQEEEHIHIDCLFLGITNEVKVTPTEIHESKELCWVTPKEFDRLDLFESTKIIGKRIFKIVNNNDGGTLQF